MDQITIKKYYCKFDATVNKINVYDLKIKVLIPIEKKVAWNMQKIIMHKI